MFVLGIVFFGNLISASSSKAIFEDYGLDENEDGFYDNLVIEMNFNVLEAANYEITSWIDGSEGGRDIEFHEHYYFEEGENTVQFYFNGMYAYYSGLNQDYNLSLEIENEDTHEEWTFIDVYTTEFYNYEEFEKPRIELLNIKDRGVDEDNDGFFDYLTLQVDVNVSEADYYEFGWDLLYYNQHSQNMQYEEEKFLEEGIQTIQFNFSGEVIRLGKFEEDYSTWIGIRDEENDFGIQSDHITDEYDYSEFEELNFRDYARDSNGNGLYESLIIEFDMNIPRDGYYVRYFLCEEENINEGFWAEDSLYFGKGGNRVYMEIDGEKIYSSGLTGKLNFSITEIEGENFEYYSENLKIIYNPDYITGSVYDFNDFENWTTETDAPVINLISPEDDYSKKTSDSSYEVDFEYEVEDESEINYCELIIDDKVADIDFDVLIGRNFFAYELDRGEYEWEIRCIDLYGNEGTSNERDIEIKKKSSSSSSSSHSNNVVDLNDDDEIESNEAVHVPTVKLSSNLSVKKSGNFLEGFWNWFLGLFG